MTKKRKLKDLRNKLKLKQIDEKLRLYKKHPHVEKLLKKKGLELGKVREHSAKILGAGALTGTLLLSPPVDGKTLPSPAAIIESLNLQPRESVDKQKLVIETLNKFLPKNRWSLTQEEEKYLEKFFKDVIGISAKATLEGEHLNTTYGRIGAEQHLRRYPGDTLAQHAPEEGEYGGDRPAEILKEGVAPGLGAWGYFAPSQAQLTEDLAGTEKWYGVVQTLYLADWSKRQPYLRDWYKYRKILIVNTENGKAVVAAIADAGPAAWTGKHFGGSPEVMDYLGGPSYKKGPVILFFVDDPENKIPLGPVKF